LAPRSDCSVANGWDLGHVRLAACGVAGSLRKMGGLRCTMEQSWLRQAAGTYDSTFPDCLPSKQSNCFWEGDVGKR
jgi:hypothetical protein